MKKGTSFKTQILNVITESYIKDKKSKIKELLKLLKENKDIRDLYSLYDEIELKYFDDINIAKFYVEKLSEGLRGKMSVIYNNKTMKRVLSEDVESYDIENCELYKKLDILLNEDNLRNIDEKIIAKKYLVNYLTTKREVKEDDEIEVTINENVLNTVLTTNFNAYYDTVLTEEERIELKSIIWMTSDELNENYQQIKNELSIKIETMINESQGELKSKLEMTKNELLSMEKNRTNYYKLTQLKNGL